MTLEQMFTIKRWHLEHQRPDALEHTLWDAVMTLWLVGWGGVPVALLLEQPGLALLCAGLIAAPGAYVALRQRLHQRGRLRCDWLGSARLH